MKSEKQGNGEKCIRIQRQIFSLFMKGHSFIIEDKIILKHLSACRECRNYVDTLPLIQKNFDDSGIENLKPRPETLNNLTAYMKIRNNPNTTKTDSIWKVIQNIFEYRVPVYQALSGAVVILFIAIFISSGFIGTEPLIYNTNGSPKLENIGVSDLNFADSLDQIDSSRGQNAKEDSLLIQFLMPSL